MNSCYCDNLRAWWDRRQVMVWRAALVVQVVLALLVLGTGFHRLLLENRREGAIDLNLRHAEVHRWFAGQEVYGVMPNAAYPPASYAILWPFVGWLESNPVRWFWAASTVAVLGWLSWLIVCESGAATRLERAALALLPLAISATGVSVGNGQLPLHILPALVVGLILLQRASNQWRQEVAGIALILIACVKPTIMVPFFWLAVFTPKTFRSGLLIVAGYVGLSLLAASFQQDGLVALLQKWNRSGVAHAAQVSLRWSYGNLHSWAAVVGLERWLTPASLLLLMGLGLWAYFHRRVDLWLLMGVTALVARLWTYHAIYDDVLILLPMVALFRVAKQSPAADGADVIAGLLFAITALTMLVPARIQLWPAPWGPLFTGGHAVVWIVVLIFLLEHTHQQRVNE